MSLKKKIILSFLISSVIIAILATSAYINFIEIKKEIRYLEMSDTIRSKSLLLRRHEKNFFLYGDTKEIESVHTYIRDLGTILGDAKPIYDDKNLLSLESKINEYSQRFNRIESLFWDFQKEFGKLTPSYPKYSAFFPLIKSTVLERPLVNAGLLGKAFLLKADSPVIKNLQELNTEINALRKDGEEILTISSALDKSARKKVDRAISLSQTAVLILFPLFLFVGLIALFIISQNVVNRLKLLTTAIEKTGRGDFSSLIVSPKDDEVSSLINFFVKMKSDLATEQDEVGKLINAFVKMEKDLAFRDQEIGKKNEELLQSRKLASIGTLASGIAHELNNPLNNIYLAAQILSKEIGEEETCPPIVKETVKDIFSQTLRVKRIVSDLLEFAREKPPMLNKVNLTSIVSAVLSQMAVSGEISDVKHTLNAPASVELQADKHLLEQVFINLFSNAVDAMEGKGNLGVKITPLNGSVEIKVSDTGKGISEKDILKIFDPFFTTKEKGTGLGLAIVYSIIKKHNGKINVSSEPYKGTTFTITLPC